MSSSLNHRPSRTFKLLISRKLGSTPINCGGSWLGLGSNLVAFGVRGGSKLTGLDHAVARPLAAWWLVAIGSYALCGVIAGLISALVWFELSADRRKAAGAEARE